MTTTKATHTPGPWHSNGPQVFAPNTRDPKFYDIARVGNVLDDEGTANARLIAAAPALLEAMRCVVDDYDTNGGDDSAMIGGETIEAARAAIASAT